SWARHSMFSKLPLIVFSLACIYYNGWLTHQSHRGGLFVSEQMTIPYLKAILLKSEVPEETIKLLDTEELFPGEPKHLITLKRFNYESDTLTHNCPIPPIEGNRSLCLTKENPFSPPIHIPSDEIPTSWVRVEADFRCQEKEWEYWRMAQLMVKFKKGTKDVQVRFLRVFRLLPPNSTKTIFLDVPVPNSDYDQMAIEFWQSHGEKPLAIDRLKVMAID
ncbi:MAG: hypothetical protein HRU12_04120, partial [Phaeodactylibacter sp.]|nr:hypothetical protein [Phaeodactylibacter sp.]